MKTRGVTPELVALLNAGGRIDTVDIYTITLLGGAVIRYTSADRPITWDGNFYPVGPLIIRDKVKSKVGVSVDSMSLTIVAPPTVEYNGVPLLSFVMNGGLDGGRVLCERVYFPTRASPPTGALFMFEGRVGDSETGRHECRMQVVSDLELLDIQLPRVLYQPGCPNTLYDSTCGLDRDDFAYSLGSVESSPAPTKTVFKNLSLVGFANDYWALGTVRFNTGANAGVARTTKASNTDGTITLINQLPFAPAAGDTFTIWPGCNKMQGTCETKFNNLLRFRGAPYVPTPETIT